MSTNQGDKMIFAGILFAMCVLSFGGALYFYYQKDDTAFSQTLNELKNVKADARLSDEAIENHEERIKILEEGIKCYDEKFQKFQGEVDYLQEHCSKLREQQIELKADLSRKRSVIEFNNPIPVQVVPRAPVPRKPRVRQPPPPPSPSPETIDRLQKQIKEMSK